MATTKKLSKVDINKLTPAEVDKMSHEALRDAVRSVIRDPNLAASHRDHRSHSSVADRVLADQSINPAATKTAVKTAIKTGTKTGAKG
jgi:hypothetical protein